MILIPYDINKILIRGEKNMNKIKKLNILQTIDGRNSLIKLPILIDILANNKDVINNIILAKIVILVSLIPYVIPRPKESILAEIASIK